MMNDRKWKDNTKTAELVSLLNDTESMVFYDLETTGISRVKDRILQFAAIRYDFHKNAILDKINLFIKCPFSIPKAITDINHITDEKLEQMGYEETEGVKLIHSFIKESDLIAGYNNRSFDDKFMERLYQEYSLEFKVKDSFDVYQYAKTIIPPEALMVKDEKTGKKKPSYKLTMVAAYLNCDNDILFHDAYGDVTATIAVFKHLITEVKDEMEKEAEREESRKQIPRQNAEISTISYFLHP